MKGEVVEISVVLRGPYCRDCARSGGLLLLRQPADIGVVVGRELVGFGAGGRACGRLVELLKGGCDDVGVELSVTVADL